MKWMNLCGKPYIWHVVERLKRCKRIDEIILYTQDVPENKEVIKLAKKWDLSLYFYGTSPSGNTLLKWYDSLNAEIVIETTNISPLIDPGNLNSAIEYFIEKDLDYLENKDEMFYYGIYKTKIWPRLYELEKDFSKFEGGWTNFVKERTDLFKTETFSKSKDMELLGTNMLKWVSLSRGIYKRFYRLGEIINLDNILSLYEKESEWFEIITSDQLEIEVTNDCNLKCIMCSRTSNMNREIGYMDLDLFKKIVYETGALSVHFSGLGEPLLHPQIREMFAYAKGKMFEVGLWTNGLKLDEGLSKEIIERQLLDYVIFSLDGATKETYAKMKGVDTFDKVVGNITRFLELKKEILKDKPKGYMARKPLVGVQIIKMKETDHEIEQFMDKWDYMDKAKKTINYKNRIQKDSGVDVELWETLYNKFLPVEHAIIGHFNNYCGQTEDRSVIDVTPLKRFSCKQLQSGISVFWNGDVTLCRQDFDGKYVLGNLKEQNLSDILESKRLKETWQRHKNGEYYKLPLCAKCKEWYYNLYA